MPAETMQPTRDALPAGVGQLDGRVMAPVPKRADVEPRLRRLLERMAAGDTPRCSAAEFEALWRLLPGLLQRESRYGADRRGGYVLTPLRRGDDQRVADWLRHNAKVTG
jgi:hypothetical protein